MLKGSLSDEGGGGGEGWRAGEGGNGIRVREGGEKTHKTVTIGYHWLPLVTNGYHGNTQLDSLNLLNPLNNLLTY